MDSIDIKQIEKNAYEQGRADEKRENEQDAYHRGYFDGKIKCSIENERKIRADERERIVSEIKKWYWDSDKQRLADDPCVVDAMIDLFIRTVRGGENENE